MTDKKKIDNEEHYVKPPSFFQMAKSFTKELAKYVKEGAPNVTEEEYVARLDTCKECEFLIERTMRCGACGCLLEHKAKWKTADCPKLKWPKLNLTEEDIKAKKAQEERVEKAKEKHVEEQLNNPVSEKITYYTPEEFKKLKELHAKRQKDNNTDSSD